LTPAGGQADGIRFLRRFGLAVARDARTVADEGRRRALVESLCNRAWLTARNGGGPPGAEMRVRLYALFIRLLHRHMRVAALDDSVGDLASYGLTGGARRDEATAQAVANLPLGLREALLLVVLEGFSHIEAAQALDISLPALIDRLMQARAALAAAMSEQGAAPPAGSRGRGAPNLRLVK
jgi:DNA-directed RNA polymerase specialized sigma24 family protein